MVVAWQGGSQQFMIHLLLVRDYTPPHAKMLATIVDAHVDTVDEEAAQQKSLQEGRGYLKADCQALHQ